MKKTMGSIVGSAILLVAFATCFFVSAEPAAKYEFCVDGKEVHPSILSLNGTPDDPQPGDIMSFGEIFVTIDKPMKYDFKYKEEDGRVYRVLADGSETVVGLLFKYNYRKGGEKELTAPLIGLKPDDLKNVRGILIDCEWTDDLTALLNAVDPAKACVTITDNTAVGEGRILPPLPKGLSMLNVSQSSSEGIKDFSGLKSLTELRFLSVRWVFEPLDLSLLSGALKLRALNLPSLKLANPGTIGSFKELRSLGLSGTDVTDVSFLKNLPELVSLSVVATKIKDLTPIAGLGKIRSVQASASLVNSIPLSAMPSLLEFDLVGSKAKDADVKLFASLNPNCRVLFGWMDALRNELKGITKLRVRTGGTCHTNPSREKTLLEITDAKELADFIAAIAIIEDDSGFECMCCGDPTFEFMRDDELAVALGFHHGRSVRWDDGSWPGDALLTPKSAKFICDYLAKRGVNEPLNEMVAESKRRDAMEIRRRKFDDLMPDDLMDELETAAGEEETLKMFKKYFKDGPGLAEFCFKLYGCFNDSWNIESNTDGLANELIAGISKKDLSTAAVNSLKDSQGLNGLVRFIMCDLKSDMLEKETLDNVLPDAGAWGLSDFRKLNRRKTIFALGEIKTEAALDLLKKCVAGVYKPREIPPEEIDEPGGMVSFRGSDREVDEKCSEQAYAAWKLAKLGDKSQLDAAKKLSEKADEADRKVLDEAIRMMSK